jgi:hypothetical protein
MAGISPPFPTENHPEAFPFGHLPKEARAMRVLVCLYTCHADREHLTELLQTPLLQWLQSSPDFSVLHVYANPNLGFPMRCGERLLLPCREDYAALSEKTYQMIRACMELPFEYLLKIDCTLASYHRKAHRKNAALLTKLSPEAALQCLQDPNFFAAAYNGLADQVASQQGVETWMETKGIACSYRSVFPSGEVTPPYFLGKLYLLRRDLCAYIAQHGQEMAALHVRHLGGSEDIMIGRLHAQWQQQGQPSPAPGAPSVRVAAAIPPASLSHPDTPAPPAGPGDAASSAPP